VCTSSTIIYAKSANTDAETTKPEDNNEAVKQVESVLYVAEEAFSDHLE